MIDFANSTQYAGMLSFLSIFLILAAISLAIFSALEYRNSLRPVEDEVAEDPWIFLFATTRDSFLISALYVVIDYLRQSNVLSANDYSVGIPTLFRLVGPFIEAAVFGLAVVINLRRLFALRRWLDQRRKK